MTENLNNYELALNLAENISVNLSPRPPVGAIITNEGELLGKGVTQPSPGNHAEINAILDCKNNNFSTKGSTMYTTLEPCFHEGETNPCVDKIIESGISQVFIGVVDPNPKVNEKSINKLLSNGIKVNIIEDEVQRKRSEDLIEPFKHFITTGMPYVTSKIAISLDGKIATKTGDSKWISSEKSREIVQKMRSLSDAIIIGSKTLKIDKPSLSAKEISEQPSYKVVLNSKPSNPERYLTLKSESEIIVFCEKTPTDLSSWKGIEFIEIASKDNKLDLKEALRILGERNCMNVLVEGGGQLIGSLIDLNLINKMRLFISPMLIGGINSADSIGGEGIEFISQSKKLTDMEVVRVESDIMVTGKVKSHV
tara:strand:+ start:25460 stop:26560 length:1101 start_codon:yes stop_codon:yes gene_type:complete